MDIKKRLAFAAKARRAAPTVRKTNRFPTTEGEDPLGGLKVWLKKKQSEAQRLRDEIVWWNEQVGKQEDKVVRINLEALYNNLTKVEGGCEWAEKKIKEGV